MSVTGVQKNKWAKFAIKGEPPLPFSLDQYQYKDRLLSRDFNHVRAFFNSADYVQPYTFFDVGGSNYRLVVIVRYRFKKDFVHKAMTHREYDDWNKLYRKSKG